MAKRFIKELLDKKTSRRKFIAGTAATGCAALAAGNLSAGEIAKRVQAANVSLEDDYKLNQSQNIIYSSCQNCNTGCAIKVKSLDGMLLKVDGSPYAPTGMFPHLPYATKIADAEKIDAGICPKGQAGPQIYHDPYRIRRVLKRSGKRGENKWISIPFEQALEEIINGGKLFATVPGEESRVVEGLKDTWALRDPKLAKEMSDQVNKILGEKDKTKKQDLVKEFQAKFKDQLSMMINPNNPDMGPRNNQFVFWWGRLKDGRGDMIKRFTLDSFGSNNAHGHTTVCQGSLYFSGKAMSEQWGYDERKNSMSWVNGRKFYWQAELEGAEFVLFVGANIYEANYGPPIRVPRITEGTASGRLKFAVLDPRQSKLAAHAWRWLPTIPGKDTAIAMAMIRWIIENKKYDAKYLGCANKAASKAAGEPNWSNASWLVKMVNGQPTTFLRAQEAGFTPEMATAKDGKTYLNEKFVVWKDGKAEEVDPNDEKTAVTGDLLVETEIGGVKVKSVMQLLFEESKKRTIEQWAVEAGVKASDVEELAKEFTSHGKKAVVDIHRGVSQHTSGFYNVIAWNTLNLLNGNYDYRGGFICSSGYTHAGTKAGQAYNIGTHPKKMPQFGSTIIRTSFKYEDSTIFEGYPAKRPWFPLISDIYQEVVPSAMDMYPYPIKTLFLYMGSPVYSLPAAQSVIDGLSDTKKIPLFVTFDTTIGETSAYADYIIPDTTYLERWEMHSPHPNNPYRSLFLRQPAAKPLTETVKVFGQEMALGLESFLMGLAEKMSLPGFGPNGFANGVPFSHMDDLYLKQVANTATDGKAVPDADDEEVKMFMEARKHLPKSVFDPERWKQACGEKFWRKAIYVLNRGGRFEDADAAWDGAKVKNKYGILINMYVEKTATTKNALTGKNFYGLPTYIPEVMDCAGKPIDDEKDGFNLTMITNKHIQHTKSRTAISPWLMAIEPENTILMSSADATKQGLKDGDRVKITSATCPDGLWKLGPLGDKPLVGKVQVSEGIRPGVISFSLGHGHFASGAKDVVIDGKTIKGDARRGTGIHANAAMRVDPVLKNTGLQDVVGGSIVFYATKVKLVKV